MVNISEILVNLKVNEGFKPETISVNWKGRLITYAPTSQLSKEQIILFEQINELASLMFKKPIFTENKSELKEAKLTIKDGVTELTAKDKAGKTVSYTDDSGEFKELSQKISDKINDGIFKNTAQAEKFTIGEQKQQKSTLSLKEHKVAHKREDEGIKTSFQRAKAFEVSQEAEDIRKEEKRQIKKQKEAHDREKHEQVRQDDIKRHER